MKDSQVDWRAAIGAPLTLRVQARPVRALYLVDSRSDIRNAVTLFTHLAAGAASAMLPCARSELDRPRLLHSARHFDPDLILLPVQPPTETLSAIEEIPCYVERITDARLSEHVAGINLLRTAGGPLPHVSTLIEATFPTPLTEASTLRLVDSGSPYVFELALAYGLPSNHFADYMRVALRARVLTTPQSGADLLKAQLIAQERMTPLKLTLFGVGARRTFSLTSTDERMPLMGHRVQRQRTLFLFLDRDEQDLHLPAAFWNSRRAERSTNKLFLPLDDFMTASRDRLGAIAAVRPFDEIVVLTQAPDLVARQIHEALSQDLRALRLDVAIRVFFGGFEYHAGEAQATFGTRETDTRIADSQGAVRFKPRPPLNDDFGQHLFGFDVEVDSASGESLSLPPTWWSSRLLQNALEHIARADRNEHGAGSFLLPNWGYPAIRASARGIAGTTLPGEELTFYAHGSAAVVRELFKSVNLRIQPSDHTRYAGGFVRRFGGLTKTLALVNRGGVRLIRALAAHRAETSGAEFREIISYLTTQDHLTNDIALALGKAELPALCAAGLVRRGSSLKCPICGLRQWHSIERLSEFVECKGCAQRFQIEGSELRFSYMLNELARRFFWNGGRAVLVTAAAIASLNDSVAIEFGGKVFELDAQQEVAEVDVVALNATTIIVAECKDAEAAPTNEAGAATLVNELDAIMRNSLAVAARIGSQVLLLGISAMRVDPEVFDAGRRFADRIQPLGIAFHLVVNGVFHLDCAVEGTSADRLSVDALRPRMAHEQRADAVGAFRRSVGFGFLEPAIGDDELRLLESGLGFADSDAANAS